MSGIEMLSEQEVEILKAYDAGRSVEDIAEAYNLKVSEAKTLIARAQQKRNRLRAIAEERKIPSYIRTVDDRLNVVQRGTMKVGSQILKHLSEGIYSSPAGSLKELISNSFDSDATEVDIRINQDEVIIQDNGNGMNWVDFDEDFTYISRSIKGLERGKTELYNRPIIGFLGIGFISISELCDTLVITSCKKDEDIFFEAEIDFSKYREPEAAKREFYEVSEYKLTNYPKKDRKIPKKASFTQIRLRKLRTGFRDIILDRKPFDEKEAGIEEILEYVSGPYGITDLGRYWQMVWELACICPVPYPKDGPVRGISSKTILDIKQTLQSYNFQVKINDVELKKPIRFPLSNWVMKSKEYSIHPVQQSIQTSKGRLSFRGYLYSQHGIINPKEYIGIMIRVKNATIGGIDRAFLGYPSGSNQLFRNWIFGEIYVDEGLEDALNINRNKFKVTHPDYVALRKWLHGFLDMKVFKHTLKEYYQKGRRQRQEIRKTGNVQVLHDIVKTEMGQAYELQLRPIDNQPFQIIRDKNTIIVNSNYPSHQVPTKLRYTIQRMFLLFGIAIEKSKGDIRKLEEVFREEIEKWINV